MGAIPWHVVIPARLDRLLTSRLFRPWRIEANSILGNQVKRLAIALGGLIFGLFVSWAFMYAISHVHIARPDHIANSCNELGKCPTPWSAAPFVLAYLCGPAIAYCALNAVAWKRWTVRKWALWGVVILIVTAALYIADYAMK